MGRIACSPNDEFQFITAKAEPNDVDIFLLMDDAFDVSKVTGEAAILFDHLAAQNYEGASIFWVNAETSFADTEDLIIGWQTRRDLQRRGIVEVVENDSE